MVNFTREILSNGLKVLVHEDFSTPLAAVNVAFDVGSRDENPEKTGFAHLFEHLMFAGSKNVKDFDEPLQNAGGDNNAYTTNDYTTFYESIPAQNIETALWLESDRMLSLNINKKSLETQRRVVLEEFKETCLNEPYGDMWHHISELMYTQHPYRWPVIGLVPEHIERATLDDVRAFYERWYTPQNAVLSICGPVRTSDALKMAEKWFADIPSGPVLPLRNLPEEPVQLEHRTKTIRSSNAPVPAVFLAFRMPSRLDADFYPVDTITDVLAEGRSSRLYRHLLKEKQMFSQIDAYVTANTDPGLLVIEGRPAKGVSPEEALAAIWNELEILTRVAVEQRELEKLKHRFESTIVFSELSVMNKAQNLGLFEMLNGAEYMNSEVGLYMAMTPDDILRAAKKYLRKENSATLIYLPVE
jgi:predicted Zn-dependent peptidase